jgi:Bacteroidetes VLRF1 release factor
MNRFLSRDTADQLLQHIRQAALPAAYDYEKHRLAILDEQGQDLAYFRLPLVLPPPGESPAGQARPVHYILLLVQAGNCAIGYFENGRNLDHKVFRAYMVRKKQGTSQIKFLKTKGKSRAGSRVRLAETAEFFDNINQRLQQYFAQHRIDRIALSCSKTLLPFLFDAKVPTPFDKRDPRLFRIPRHIHTPIYEVMMDTHKYLLKGELLYEEARQAEVEALLGGVLHLREDQAPLE